MPSNAGLISHYGNQQLSDAASSNSSEASLRAHSIHKGRLRQKRRGRPNASSDRLSEEALEAQSQKRKPELVKFTSYAHLRTASCGE